MPLLPTSISQKEIRIAWLPAAVLPARLSRMFWSLLALLSPLRTVDGVVGVNARQIHASLPPPHSTLSFTLVHLTTVSAPIL